MRLWPDQKYARRILQIATPAIAGLSSQMVVSIIDTAMVGRLGNSGLALAAMGLGVLATWTLTSFFSSLATGTHILVARRYGEGRYRAAGIVLNNSLLLSFLLGTLFGVLGYYFSYEFIRPFSSDDSVARAAAEYMRFRSLGLPFFLLGVSYRGFFYGIGRTKVFMFSAIIGYLVNIVFNYFLIFGTFGFPQMGLAGAGLSASLGMVLGFLFFVGVTLLPAYRRQYRYYRAFSISVRQIRQIVRISFPVSLQNILILLGFLIFVAIAGIFGTMQQAATQVVITALFLSFMPCFGFGIAAQTLVGNALGENRPDEARRFTMETAKLTTIFTILLGTLFVLVPGAFLRVITTNESVVSIALPLLVLAGIAQVPYGAGIIFANSLQAAGATVFVMYLEILTHWIIFLPIAYLSGRHWGIVGAWMALPMYIVAYSLLTWWKFRGGSWTRLRI